MVSANLINNIDLDGSLLGFDIETINQLKKNIDCPILALGGAGNGHFQNYFVKQVFPLDVLKIFFILLKKVFYL